MNEQQKSGEENIDTEPKEKFVAKNWEFFKKDEKSVKKLAPQQRSKYLAYEEPPKDILEAKTQAAKRLAEQKKQKLKDEKTKSLEENEDQVNQSKLIGQLKAAEARNRIRIMRLRYEANRSQEVNHLIACQPTARKAVRLQALVPAKLESRGGGDKLDKLSRARVEALLDDGQGLLTLRT